MVGLIKHLRSEAVRRHESLALHLEIDSNRYWVEFSNMDEEERMRAGENARAFPPDIRIIDVRKKDEGMHAEGEATIFFSEKGYVQQSVIHLGSTDGRRFTLLLSPFLGKVRVFERYVDFEDA